jgi:hypothetical protein
VLAVELASDVSLERPPKARWKRFLYENSLLLVVALFAVLTIVPQTLTGWHVYNEELNDHGLPELALGSYVGSGHWLEATFENWESEFLQMGLFVLLAVWLRQKGSTESKKLYEREEVDRDGDPKRKGAPWPVRRGGIVLALYRNSLAIAFFVLFLASMWLHARGGAEVESIERVAKGEPPVDTLAYMGTSKFWFESLQNWQSEFVAIVSIVGLTIFLRQKGSPQSKPVDESNDETGH